MCIRDRKALTIACQRTQARIRDYTAGPVYMGSKSNGAHEWLIEFETPPESLSHFTEALDNALKSINTDYEAKRTGDLTLRPPIIRSMPNGTFYAWLKSKNKLGGQHKVPRLANHRDYLESVLRLTTANASVA